MNLGATAIYGTVPHANAMVSFVHTAFRNQAPTIIRNKAIQSSGARMLHLSINATCRDTRRCRAHRALLRPCQASASDDGLLADGESTRSTVADYSGARRCRLDRQLCRAAV